jgi:arsenite-transporting ATPase
LGADSVPVFLNNAPRHLFFTGKGGVGKTSLACASAVLLAETGRRVLIVSTDPASNLDAVLETTLASRPTPVAGVPTLWAMNIDPEEAARDYRERTVGPHRGVLPAAEIALLEEPCRACCRSGGVRRIALLLADGSEPSNSTTSSSIPLRQDYTLRLLELPAAWTAFSFPVPATHRAWARCRASRPGSAMRNGCSARESRLTLAVVAHARRGALVEAARATGELPAQGMRNQCLAINGVFRPWIPQIRSRPLSRGVQRTYCDDTGSPCRHSARRIALRPQNLVGLDALRRMFAPLGVQCPPPPRTFGCKWRYRRRPVDGSNGRTARMVMGKSGVGKTTVAAAIAVALAQQTVQLLTSDPARHIADTLQVAVPNLKVDFIDPKQEVQRYARTPVGEGEPAEQIELLREVRRRATRAAVFGFSARYGRPPRLRDRRYRADGPHRHSTTGAITGRSCGGRRIRRPPSHASDDASDRDYTKVLIVALAETTPVLEAASLQDDLRRAAIEPFAWVINASLAAARPTDPILRARAAAEIAQFDNVRTRYAQRIACVPFQAAEPIGVERLLDLGR